jgi:hypothetical protein
MNLIEKYSDEYLIKHLKDLAKKLGRTPFGKDIDKAGKIKYWIYYKRYGSLLKAQKAAGLVPTRSSDIPKYTHEDVINFLRELSVKLGRRPKIVDILAAKKIGLGVINKRFRKFTKALDAAGIKPDRK